ncbi:MAG: hypothetical protein LBQ02_04460 [Candidatus Nomurabacteria bacterium]|jgi:hypothetical protein|nr:hypothetical protein [Candidatus Nomurabacteria bacterium]
MSFALGSILKPSQAILDREIATSDEVSAYLTGNPGASLNDIVNNFTAEYVIELPAGNYMLSDNLVVYRRLIVKAAEGVKADEVVVDGASYWNDQTFVPGYYIDLAFASTMIEGVTLTNLGASTPDNNIYPEFSQGYAIAVRGGTLNRCVIVNNYTLSGAALIGLFNGTLSGNLIAHNNGSILASGTSHWIGNTMVNNIGRQVNYSGSTIDSFIAVAGDPILENNVLFNNQQYPNSFTDKNGDEYYDTAGVLFTSTNWALGVPGATVKYIDNWIHRDTENNFFGKIYYDEDYATQFDAYAGYFNNFPAVQGAWGKEENKPDFDYSPVAGSPLIDAGTDVFYPSIPKDLNGNSHFLGVAPDLGAYEAAGDTPVFTQYSTNRVYVTEHGAGTKDGTSWTNAMDGNGQGGPQDALIAAVRGNANEVWFAEGEYLVKGREFQYTTSLHGKAGDLLIDYFTSGVWGGIIIAPSKHDVERTTSIYGGFAGHETSTSERPTFTYVNEQGADTGVRLIGASQERTSHFIGERGLTLSEPVLFPTFNTDLNFVPIQPDQYNLVNPDAPTLRYPTLPSQGVRVFGQVELGTALGSGGDQFRPTIDGVEVSNGFDAIFDPMTFGGATTFSFQNYGGAGIFTSAYVRNAYVHDNYDAVAAFEASFIGCGGGIFNMGGTVSNSVVTNNVSETAGGGIMANNGTDVYDSYVAGNWSYYEGGGIHTGSVETGAKTIIANTVVTDNHTRAIPTGMFANPTGNGGGIWMSGSAKLYDSTVFGNSTTQAMMNAYKLTIPSQSPLYAHKNDLEGDWVLDESYFYPNYTSGLAQSRYIRQNATSPYYYYVFAQNGATVFYHTFSDLATFDPSVNGPESLLEGFYVYGVATNAPTSTTDGWTVNIKEVPNANISLGGNIFVNNNTGGEIKSVVSLNGRLRTPDGNGGFGDTAGTDIYLANPEALANVTYSAAMNVETPDGKAALRDTNVTSGLDDFSLVFVNHVANNFRISKTSPLFGMGEKIADIDSDITGLWRRSADIGAYTYYTEDGDSSAEDGLGVPNTGDNSTAVVSGHKDSANHIVSFALIVSALATVTIIFVFVRKRNPLKLGR